EYQYEAPVWRLAGSSPATRLSGGTVRAARHRYSSCHGLGNGLALRYAPPALSLRLSAVAEAGGDAVDRHVDAAQRLFVIGARTAAAQKIELKQIERIDIGQTEPYRFRERG